MTPYRSLSGLTAFFTASLIKRFAYTKLHSLYDSCRKKYINVTKVHMLFSVINVEDRKYW